MIWHVLWKLIEIILVSALASFALALVIIVLCMRNLSHALNCKERGKP